MTEFKTSRLQLGVSQYRLSKLSGVARHKISTHETGYTSLSESELRKIAAALKKLQKQLQEVNCE